VDEGVALLVERLGALGQLENTWIFFTSDNGFHLGEHRMGWGKQSPYEEDIALPLVVRGPGVPAGRAVSALAGNTDLAPTLVDVAGSSLAYDPDGRSLRPWLDGSPGSSRWRHAYLLDLWKGTSRADRDRDGKTRVPPFHGVRTDRHLYVEYATGERELYDVARDPHELENAIATAPRQLVDALAVRVAALRACAGAACREVEDLPVDAEGAVADPAPLP
jgi:arylsulfatase A-like enzyme